MSHISLLAFTEEEKLRDCLSTVANLVTKALANADVSQMEQIAAHIQHVAATQLSAQFAKVFEESNNRLLLDFLYNWLLFQREKPSGNTKEFLEQARSKYLALCNPVPAPLAVPSARSQSANVHVPAPALSKDSVPTVIPTPNPAPPKQKATKTVKGKSKAKPVPPTTAPSQSKSAPADPPVPSAQKPKKRRRTPSPTAGPSRLPPPEKPLGPYIKTFEELERSDDERTEDSSEEDALVKKKVRVSSAPTPNAEPQTKNPAPPNRMPKKRSKPEDSESDDGVVAHIVARRPRPVAHANPEAYVEPCERCAKMNFVCRVRLSRLKRKKQDTSKTLACFPCHVSKLACTPDRTNLTKRPITEQERALMDGNKRPAKKPRVTQEEDGESVRVIAAPKVVGASEPAPKMSAPKTSAPKTSAPKTSAPKTSVLASSEGATTLARPGASRALPSALVTKVRAERTPTPDPIPQNQADSPDPSPATPKRVIVPLKQVPKPNNPYQLQQTAAERFEAAIVSTPVRILRHEEGDDQFEPQNEQEEWGAALHHSFQGLAQMISDDREVSFSRFDQRAYWRSKDFERAVCERLIALEEVVKRKPVMITVGIQTDTPNFVEAGTQAQLKLVGAAVQTEITSTADASVSAQESSADRVPTLGTPPVHTVDAQIKAPIITTITTIDPLPSLNVIPATPQSSQAGSHNAETLSALPKPASSLEANEVDNPEKDQGTEDNLMVDEPEDSKRGSTFEESTTEDESNGDEESELTDPDADEQVSNADIDVPITTPASVPAEQNLEVAPVRPGNRRSPRFHTPSPH